MPRSVERDLIPDLIAYRGYRQARWQAVILYGLAGIGKTAMARSLADNEHIRDAFRDGVAWVDGSRDPEAEVARLCLALDLIPRPGEHPVECWRRWAGASERRLLLIVDDAISAEELPPLIAGLGPQVALLITTQQGAEVRAEVERWLPTDAIMEISIAGLAPSEGRALVEAVRAGPLADPEWEIVQQIGEQVGWHPEALRLAAIEGREVGWQGMLGGLQVGRMPWDEVRRLVLKQWGRLHSGQRDWLSVLLRGVDLGARFTTDEASRLWQVEPVVVNRRLHILERSGLVMKESGAETARLRWQMAPMGYLMLIEMMQQGETRRNEKQ